MYYDINFLIRQESRNAVSFLNIKVNIRKKKINLGKLDKYLTLINE